MRLRYPVWACFLFNVHLQTTAANICIFYFLILVLSSSGFAARVERLLSVCYRVFAEVSTETWVLCSWVSFSVRRGSSKLLSPLLTAGSNAGLGLPLPCRSSPAQGDCHFPGTIFCLHSALSCPSHEVLGFSYYSLMCLEWCETEHVPLPRFWVAWGLLLEWFTSGSLPWCWSLSGPMLVTVNEGDEQSVCTVLPPCINTPSRNVRVGLVIWLLLLSQERFPTRTEMDLPHHLNSCKDCRFFNNMKAEHQFNSYSAVYYTIVVALQIFFHSIQQGHTAPSRTTSYVWTVSCLSKKWKVFEHWQFCATSPVTRLIQAEPSVSPLRSAAWRELWLAGNCSHWTCLWCLLSLQCYRV